MRGLRSCERYVASIWGLESQYNGAPIDAPVIVLLDGAAEVWGVDMPVSGQQALLDFVADGGGLMVTEWVLWDHMQHGQYVLLNTGLPAAIQDSWGTDSETFSVLLPGHPIAQNLPDQFRVEAISYSRLLALRGDVVVAGKRTGASIIADATSGGRVVYCAFAGVSDGLSGTLDIRTEPMRLLMRNIVEWLAQ